MKRILLILLVVVLSVPALAQKQDNFFQVLTKEFADQDGFSASMITSDMFDLYIKKRNIDEDSPVFDALKKLEKITVVSQSRFTGVGTGQTKEKDEALSNNVHVKLLNHYNSSDYVLFKTEKRMGEDVKVYLKKSQGKIQALALVTNSLVATNLVELQGDIDLKTVSELNQALNLRGLENLYKIDNGASSRYVGFSYPEKRAVELAALQNVIAGKAELTKEQQIKLEEQARLMAEKQMQVAKKYREMAEKYQRQPIFLSYPGDTNTVYYLNGKKISAKKIKEIEKEKIKSIEVNKADNDGDKTVVRIKTK